MRSSWYSTTSREDSKSKDVTRLIAGTIRRHNPIDSRDPIGATLHFHVGHSIDSSRSVWFSAHGVFKIIYCLLLSFVRLVVEKPFPLYALCPCTATYVVPLRTKRCKLFILFHVTQRARQ